MIYKDRACEICGLAEMREVFSWEKKCRTRSGWHLWKIRNVVCEGCGFAFVSPAPTIETLNTYYAHSYALLSGTQINTMQRIEFLESFCLKEAKSVLEIGGNQAGEFAAKLISCGAQYINCEINSQVNDAVKDLSSIENSSIDILVSYYVFEHIIALPTMISECRRVLKDDATFVIEVPDIGYYAHLMDAVGFHEHVNHFSLRTLCALLGQNGFELKRFSRKQVSRRFGMVAAFKKCSPKSISYSAEIEVLDSIALLTSGQELMINANQRIAEFRTQILDWSAKGENIIFWSANAVAQEVIGQIEIPGNSVLIDIDPGKRDFIEGHQAFLPTERIQEIMDTDRIIIFTEVHAPAIKLSLQSYLADRFNKVSITVFAVSE